MRRFFFLMSFLAASMMVFAQSNRVYAGVDKKAILIGEQFHLKLDMEEKKGQPVSFFAIDSIPHFEIMDRSKIDTFPSASGIILSQTLLLTSWDSGHWQIPALSAGKAKTAPIGIDVGYSPLAPDQSYHDIKDILNVKLPQESNWYWYLAGLALLLILFLLFFPRGKPREKPKEEKVEDKDAFSRALQRIDRLALEKQPNVKEYYTELIDIFREYLEKRKSIHSFSKTTGDLSRQIRALALQQELYQKLVATLDLSDMVKFARYQPSAEESQQSKEIIKQNIIAIEDLK